MNLYILAQGRMMSSYQFKSIQVTQAADHVYQVQLNRPDKRNSLNDDMWK